MDWAPAGGSIVTRARAVDAGIEAGGIRAAMDLASGCCGCLQILIYEM